MNKKYITIFLCLFILISTIQIAEAALKINIVAVNATDDASKDYPVKYYLPKELKPDDIIDAGGLTVEYDPDKQMYFAGGTLTLGPKESRTIKIQVNDVWKISSSDVESLKKQIDEDLARVQNTPNYESGKALKDSLVKQLDSILAEQEAFSGNVERRIEAYRSHVDQLGVIKEKVFSVEFWEGKKVTETQKPAEEEEKGKFVRLVIEVENPQENETKSIKHQHYLPKEIKAEDIVDMQGFEVRYDDDKKQSYLVKEEEFKPGEKKRYEIEIKDVWEVSQQDQKDLNERAKSAFAEIKKSPYGKEYMNNANTLLSTIDENITSIDKLQKEKTTVKEHIGAYRVNEERLKATDEDLKKLERILALVREKRLEELEKSRVKNVLQRMQALKGIESVSKAIFGQKPTNNNTWRIIWITLGFIAVFTAIHFFTWWQRSQAAKLKEAQGAKQAKT